MPTDDAFGITDHKMGLVSIDNVLHTVDVTGALTPVFAGAPINRQLIIIFDGGGDVLDVGAQIDVEVGFYCQISHWHLLADQSGSVAIDIWKDYFSNYPPTDTDSITMYSTPPLLSGTDHGDGGSEIDSWDSLIYPGMTLRFNIDSVTSITRVALILDLLGRA